jgi:hypothetical protein
MTYRLVEIKEVGRHVDEVDLEYTPSFFEKTFLRKKKKIEKFTGFMTSWTNKGHKVDPELSLHILDMVVDHINSRAH